VNDPGTFVMTGYAGGVVQQWAARLELPPPAVAALISRQPPLLEVTANTVKARLETLAALFGCPIEVRVEPTSPPPNPSSPAQKFLTRGSCLAAAPTVCVLRCRCMALCGATGSCCADANGCGARACPFHRLLRS
jgi:hypothetical protein